MSLFLLGLPLLGTVLAGKPISPYLQFPPLTDFVSQAPFSWNVFFTYGLLDLISIAILIFISLPAHSSLDTPPHRHYPWWGWLSLIWLGFAWAYSWGHFAWSDLLNQFKFTLIWIGYILVINAWTWKRRGCCLLTERFAYLLLLFPTSVLFWWYFEYLNRFVQNWHYLGVENQSPLEYSLQASAAFSTVLPAVISTIEMLKTLPYFRPHRRFKMPLNIKYPGLIAWLVLLIASAGLVGTGIKPNYFYSLLWVSPLLIFVSLQVLLGEKTYFSALSQGQYLVIILPVVAGIGCGFLWEMWNYYSYPKWAYTVPYVQRFKLFEMPILGYAGYFPFGLECAVIADFVLRLTPYSDKQP